MNYIPRPEYEAAKAHFIATVTRLMEAKELTSAAVQKLTTAEVMAGRATASVSMQDLHHYLHGLSLPRTEKLTVLATVLGVHPDTLVPKRIRNGRVARRAARAYHVDDIAHVDVVPVPSSLDATVHFRLRIPAEKAFAFATVLRKYANKEVARAQGQAIPIEGFGHFSQFSDDPTQRYDPARDAVREIGELEVELDAALQDALQKQ